MEILAGWQQILLTDHDYVQHSFNPLHSLNLATLTYYRDAYLSSICHLYSHCLYPISSPSPSSPSPSFCLTQTSLVTLRLTLMSNPPNEKDDRPDINQPQWILSTPATSGPSRSQPDTPQRREYRPMPRRRFSSISMETQYVFPFCQSSQ